MSAFAQTLADRIKGHTAFWQDLELVSSLALRQMIPALASQGPADNLTPPAIARLLRSAAVFSQAGTELDQGLAQDVALYAAIASPDPANRVLARDILTDLGNHPGAERLGFELNIPAAGFSSYLRTSLLRELNKVRIGDQDFTLTDFQQRVWTGLPDAKALAISAPTSAGKSFVVLEYLCQQAVLAKKFVAVFIAPTRALLTEVHGKISQRLNGEEGIRVSTIPTLDSADRPKQIFVLTQERLQVLLASWAGTFDLVIVDEAQAIGDDSRGMILQDCLETLHQRRDATRFLFLAPGATGFDVLTQAINVDQIAIQETDLSPVVQNRIMVEPVVGEERRIALTLMTGARPMNIGVFDAERGFGNADTRLAAVALELGRQGGSLVYGTGPANAEEVAGQIASALKEQDDPLLRELSTFVEKHVHPRYSLAKHVLKGVGFHYGRMPSLLRETLEESFKEARLKYLVCTTTLFQGVNLPARNVFIDTPTRGRGQELDPAALWNFAGRAGRLGKDIIGNVFLVGYASWETKPLSVRARFQITPSFRKTVATHRLKILGRLRDQPLPDEGDGVEGVTEAAAGLLISRAARGSLHSFVQRTVSDTVSAAERQELVDVATEAFAGLDLPAEAVAINWTVNPFGQARLLKRFREKIAAGEIDDLIPVHPAPWTKAIYSRYVGIYSRLNREIYGTPASPKFNNSLASVSLAWMGGQPLPVIIDKKLKYLEDTKTGSRKVNIDTAIRKVFEFVEDVLRFKYVQLGRAYIDLLRFALEEAGLKNEARGIYDFPLALELGVSTVAGQAFIELGLSRISASALEGLIPDSNPSVEKAREWLGGLTGVEFKLSRVIWDELARKGLMAKVA